MQRVLGDVYEQILAMTPVREKGRIALKAGKTPADERKALAAHYTPEGFVYEIVRPALLAVFSRCWADAKGDLGRYREALGALRVLDPAMGSAHFLTVTALEIARELAWVQVFSAPQPVKHFEPLAPGEPWDGIDAARLRELEQHVRQVLPDVVRRSCYGVDIQPLATELGKLSLWLLTMTARPGTTPELTFVDANIRCGDSLVGIRWVDAIGILRERLGMELRERDALALGGSEVADSRAFLEETFARLAGTADELRRWVTKHRAELELDPKSPLPEDHHLLRELVLDRARARQEELRWLLDLAVLAEWHGNPESLFDAIAEHVPALGRVRGMTPPWREVVAIGERAPGGRANKVRGAICALASNLELAKGRTGRAFHWELELPAVFASGGFDVVVANPPFRGDRDLTSHVGVACVEYLKRRLGSGQVLDYATYFVLRYDEVIREGLGVIGTVGPNTLGQGKNRRLGLKRLVAAGHRLFRALPSRTWPGDANVHVCLVHLGKGVLPPPLLVVREYLGEDSEEFSDHPIAPFRGGISSYLDGLDETEHAPLPSMMDGLALQGMQPHGFHEVPLEYLDDAPTRERDALRGRLNNETLQQRARPTPDRLVIDFHDEADAGGKPGESERARQSRLKARYPTLFQQLARNYGDKKREGDWWAFHRPRPELRAAWAEQDAVVLTGRHMKVWAPIRTPICDPRTGLRICPTDALNVSPIASLAFLAAISSPVFEVQLRRACSTIKSDLRVTPTEVFPGFPLPWPSTWSAVRGRPFPLPVPLEVERLLGPPIERVLELRAAILAEPEKHGLADEHLRGPTDLYNAFDRRDIELPAIRDLRAAHRDLLDAVLAAYGWSLKPTWTFERPWIDGTLRYVPDARTRAAFIENLATLNAARRISELRLCAEHVASAVPRTGVLTNRLKEVLDGAGVQLSDDEREAALEEAVRLGLIKSQGQHVYRPA